MANKKQKYINLIKIFFIFGGLLLMTSSSFAAGFNRDLKVGMQGPDVKALQQFLNTHGFLISPSGPGSLGLETNLFGTLTKKALIKFQEFNSEKILKPFGLKKGTGNLFAATRSFINSQIEQESALKLNFNTPKPTIATTTPEKITHTSHQILIPAVAEAFLLL